eukprot:GFKZ01011002.1.p6 GENE.GFKZ01011002.1~~GFKZ01011002.1.p6  ORF type:complete len:108 (-),score=6.15 GFKZ01011002.1:1054-1377(-)
MFAAKRTRLRHRSSATASPKTCDKKSQSNLRDKVYIWHSQALLQPSLVGRAYIQKNLDSGQSTPDCIQNKSSHLCHQPPFRQDTTHILHSPKELFLAGICNPYQLAI